MYYGQSTISVKKQDYNKHIAYLYSKPNKKANENTFQTLFLLHLAFPDQL